MLALTDISVKAQLVPFIRKITLFESSGVVEFKQRLMPSMYTYLSFNMKDIPVFICAKQKFQPAHRLQIAGPKTRSNIYVEHKGSINQILVEFTATGFYELFHRTAAAYCNQLVDYNLLRDDAHIAESMMNCKNLDDCCDHLQNHLIDISGQAIVADDRICKALNFINGNKGIISVQNVCDEVNMSVRNFNRNFKEICGVSPQIFLKILRLHRIIGSMSGSENGNKMFDIAYLSGFFDQAHFNRSFKKLVTLSPRQFLQSSEHVSLKYFERE